MANHKAGHVFIVAAPSGGGKTSLVKHVVDSMDDMTVSVSHTTRDKRPGEEDGKHYFFVDESRFQDMAKQDAFIEHACVFDHWYGTSKAQIQEKLDAGLDVILDIDWQGAEQIKALFADAVGIFIVPPSLETLKTRLQSRKRDNDQVIADRMQQACDEMSHYHEFDYLIVNDDFDKAASELQAIVVANRLKVARQIEKQRKLLSFLLSSQ